MESLGATINFKIDTLVRLQGHPKNFNIRVSYKEKLIG